MPSSDWFSWRFRVRYHETDPQQFVFNSRYLEYADTAMTEYFRHLGWNYLNLLAAGFDPSLVTTQLTFQTPARLEDQVAALVRCTRVGRSSFDLQILIRRGDETLTEISSTYVNVDGATGKSKPVPDGIAESLRAEVARNDGA